MDSTMIRLVCGILALAFAGVIFMRRKKREE